MKQAFHLFFEEKMVKKPVMFLAARDCGLVLSVRLASIKDHAGEAVVELEGEVENIEKAVRLMREQGVKVESVLGDILQ